MFGDYKSYKNFAPQYADWKYDRDLAEAKRIEYLSLHPQDMDIKDIQKSKTILRAIDIMDEFSQKRAEDMEVATEAVVSQGLSWATTIGSALGVAVLAIPKISNKIKKTSKEGQMLAFMASVIGGALIATFPAFPLFAWAAKAEVNASRRGRFEAMRNELKDPKTFAILTNEQEKELEELSEKYEVKNEKKRRNKKSIYSNKLKLKDLKEMAIDSKEFKAQKQEFEAKIEDNYNNIGKELTEKEILDAKKDQQLLLKLVEKIDIASQDYAENAELATSALTTSILALSGIGQLIYSKVAKFLRIKQSIAPMGVGIILSLGASIWANSIQKQASRVGRFKIKQELLNNPEQLVYVSDEKTKEIVDVEVNLHKKDNVFKFIRNLGKNNKEFNNWKKTEGEKEKNLAKAMQELEITDEQLKEAKRIQYNTFRTFNEVDEKSQKYAESVEAIGQSIQLPISQLFTGIGTLLGMKHMDKIGVGSKAQATTGLIKYMGTILLFTLPSIIINAFITKEQKKAARVANMEAINELSDYRKFADYSRYTEKESEVF